MIKSLKSASLAAGIFLLMGLGGLLLMAAQTPEVPPVEVTENPALLLSSTAKVADLTVYGVKLGDPIEKIPASVQFVKTPSETNPNVVYCAARDVTYMAHNGRIIEIVVGGAIIGRLAPYDTTRLQIALGRADEVLRDSGDEPTACLSYFQRRQQFVVAERALRSRIVEVNLYAP